METPPRRFMSADVVAKVQRALEEVALRGRALPSEETRIKEAFTRLANPSQLSNKKGEREYLYILQQIKEKCGPQMVAVVAAGLGKSAIIGMKKRERLQLPTLLSNHISELESTILQNLAQDYREHAFNSNLPIEQFIPREQTVDSNLTIEQVVPSEQAYLEPDSREPHSRVFKLTLEDAKSVIASNHVRGTVYLIEPHGKQSLPFITVNLTEELCGHFTRMRNPV